MRKFIYTALITGIIVMLSGSFEAEAQNRRNSGSTQQTTSTTSRSSSNSSSYSRSSSKTSSSQTKSSSKESKKSDSKTTTRPVNQSNTRSQNNNQSQRPAQATQSTSKSTPQVEQQRPRTSTGTTQTRRVDPQVKQDAKHAERQVEREANRIEHEKNAPGPRDNKPNYRPEPHYNSSFNHPYMERDYRPAPFHIAGHHSFGYRINTLPRGYEIRYVRSTPYYYYDGIYYRPFRDGGYVIVRPPIGSYIASKLLDVALTAVVLNSIENTYERIIAAQAAKDAQYYYGDGIYYRTRDNGEYEVIDAPTGALVSQLPEDFEEVTLNGKSYYQVEDVLYKVVIIDGHPFFEVVAVL